MLGNWTWNPNQWDAIVNLARHEKMYRNFSREPNSLTKRDNKKKADNYAQMMRKIALKAETKSENNAHCLYLRPL